MEQRINGNQGRMIELTTEDNQHRCNFCNRCEIRAFDWGGMYRYDNIVVHYFCLLFSAGLQQKGEDEDGIFGFLPQDIKKEIKRGAKLKCKFCKRPGASVGCSVKSCKASFHFTCGIENGTLHHFLDKYESFCPAHKRLPKIPEDLEDYSCMLCRSDIEAGKMVWSPCCRTRVYDKECIQKYAYTAGYHHFKCPNCNAKGRFTRAMQRSGIYVPERDAAWELEPNAFAELNQEYCRCDAPRCLCPQGREHSHHREWKIIRCNACGGSGVHRKCGGISSNWTCSTCAVVVGRERPLTPTVEENDWTSSSGRSSIDLEDRRNIIGLGRQNLVSRAGSTSTSSSNHADSDSSSVVSMSDSSTVSSERPRITYRRRSRGHGERTMDMEPNIPLQSVRNTMLNMIDRYKEKEEKPENNSGSGASAPSSRLGTTPTFGRSWKEAANVSKHEREIANQTSLPDLNTPGILAETILSNLKMREAIVSRMKKMLSNQGRGAENQVNMPSGTDSSENEGSTERPNHSGRSVKEPVEVVTINDDDDDDEDSNDKADGHPPALNSQKPAPCKRKRSASDSAERIVQKGESSSRTADQEDSKTEQCRSNIPKRSHTADANNSERKIVEIVIYDDDDDDDLADFQADKKSQRGNVPSAHVGLSRTVVDKQRSASPISFAAVNLPTKEEPVGDEVVELASSAQRSTSVDPLSSISSIGQANKEWKMKDLALSPAFTEQAMCFIYKRRSVCKFTLCAAEDVEKMEELRLEIDQYGKSCQPISRIPEEGDIVFVLYEEDKSFYRCRVDSFLDLDEIQVTFIDFGDTAAVWLYDCVEPCDEIMKKHPVYSILFKLQLNVECPDNIRLPRELEAAETKPVFMYTDSKSDDGSEWTGTLQLVDGRAWNEILEDYIVACNNRSKLNPQQAVTIANVRASQTVTALSEIPLCASLAGQKRVEVFINFIWHYTKFTVTSAKDEHNLTELYALIQKYAEKAPPMERVPAVGEVVIAPYEGLYHRALVTKAVGWAITVQFIEYGDEATMMAYRLKEMSREISMHPLYGITFIVGSLPRITTRITELDETIPFQGFVDIWSRDGITCSGRLWTSEDENWNDDVALVVVKLLRPDLNFEASPGSKEPAKPPPAPAMKKKVKPKKHPRFNKLLKFFSSMSKKIAKLEDKKREKRHEGESRGRRHGIPDRYPREGSGRSSHFRRSSHRRDGYTRYGSRDRELGRYRHGPRR